NSGHRFDEYEGGYEEFFEEFKRFFADPRRFTYTPVISCRGCKPVT
ncbi:MAG: methyltransferase type 11, partial [Deltaproteobacteria bacterium]|nr:methyltransferase type 11 [Deltaproteobacteria bacterium]